MLQRGEGTSETTESAFRECRVCGDRSDGAHFGIDACRACAAFFRRSVVLGKRYVCRQGGNNCVIRKSVRCMCRKCRLQQCINSGMLPEQVQGKRDPITNSGGFSKTEGGDGEGSDSENELVKQSSVIVSPTPVHTQSFRPVAILPEAEQPHLLLKIDQNYKQLCAVRRATELATSNASLRDLFETTSPLSGWTPATTTRVTQIFRATLPAVSDFIKQTFEEFNLLDQDEKWTQFRSYLATLFILEEMWRSHRLVPPDKLATINLCTETTYMDLSNLEAFLADVPIPNTRINDLIRLLRICMERPRENMLQILASLNVKDEEFAALLALALFNPNVEKSTPRIDEISRGMRTKIYEQLHIFYRSNNIENYSARLGELMCLLSCVVQSASRMKEDMELFKLFDVFSHDSFMYDIIKR